MTPPRWRTAGTFPLRRGRSSAGLGLYTKAPIKKGSYIIEYIGRELREGEIYTITSQYLFEITKKKTIDGKGRDNLARYINHSCRPNCEVEIEKERVWIIAKRDIAPGEELSYNYGKSFWREYIEPKGCRCVKCRPDLHVNDVVPPRRTRRTKKKN